MSDSLRSWEKFARTGPCRLPEPSGEVGGHHPVKPTLDGYTGGGDVQVRFDWNARKAAANHRIHGVSFDEAASVFLDSLSATGADPDHSLDERRFVTFGVLSVGVCWWSHTSMMTT
jgi:uncharacterized DUF497 family protein